MGNDSTWLNLIVSAHTVLAEGQPINRHLPHIQLIVEPSFKDSFHLQLEFHDQSVKWFRTTWLKSLDAPRFQQITQNQEVAEPSIKLENGETDLASVLPIVELIQTLSVKPTLEKRRRIVLDGTFFTLKIGVEYTETAYKWHSALEDWKDLATLATMILALNDRL